MSLSYLHQKLCDPTLRTSSETKILLLFHEPSGRPSETRIPFLFPYCVLRAQHTATILRTILKVSRTCSRPANRSPLSRRYKRGTPRASQLLDQRKCYKMSGL